MSGLAVGKSLMLAGANGDNAVVNASGAFAFPTALVAGLPYTVTVTGHPAGQTCTVQNGSGTIAAANVTNVAITCVQAQFVVVADRGDLTLSVYRTHPETGELTAVPNSPFPTLVPVNDIAFLPSGLIGYAVMGRQPLDRPVRTECRHWRAHAPAGRRCRQRAGVAGRRGGPDGPVALRRRPGFADELCHPAPHVWADPYVRHSRGRPESAGWDCRVPEWAKRLCNER